MDWAWEVRMSLRTLETSEAGASRAAAPELDLAKVVERTPLRDAPFDHI